MGISIPSSRRVLMYSHDTFGLGHLTRTLRIAEGIQARHPNVSILVLSGLPVAPYLPLPPRTDLVKLPSVLKSGPEQYRSRDLQVDFAQIRAMRRSVIAGTAETFLPHVFLVDNVPLGMKGEVLPALEALRGRARCVLNLRDILDEPEAIRTRWESDGVYAALDRYYDAVHVFGDAGVFDPIAAYGLPAEKTRMLGYVTPSDRIASSEPPAAGEARAPRRVLVTAGGGGDGLPLLEASLEGLSLVRRSGAYDLDVELITGPLMDDESRLRLLRRAGEQNVRIVEFVPDLPARMRNADLVVAMAGYNTCSEILACGTAALLHPRIHPRLEQKIRAEAFASLGLARVLPGGDPSPADVAEAVVGIFRDEHRLDEESLPQLNGQHHAAGALDRWLQPAPSPRHGGAPGGAKGRTNGSGFVANADASGEGRDALRIVSLAQLLPVAAKPLLSTWLPPWPGALAI